MKRDRQTDSINLRGMQIRCHIGVTAAERRRRQTVMADIALKCDLSLAGKSDRLADTVDYSVIAGKISALAARESFCLLESLARRIAEICLAESKVMTATIKVAKKGVLPNISSVEVEITRKQQNKR